MRGLAGCGPGRSAALGPGSSRRGSGRGARRIPRVAFVWAPTRGNTGAPLPSHCCGRENIPGCCACSRAACFVRAAEKSLFVKEYLRKKLLLRNAVPNNLCLVWEDAEVPVSKKPECSVCALADWGKCKLLEVLIFTFL